MSVRFIVGMPGRLIAADVFLLFVVTAPIVFVGDRPGT